MTHVKDAIWGAESSGVTAVGAEPVTRLKEPMVFSNGSTLTC